MSDDTVIGTLRGAEGMLEVYRRTTYVCYRNAAAGQVQEVTVAVLDAGASSPAERRFNCTARSDDGRFAAGDPAASAEATVATLRWSDLDREE